MISDSNRAERRTAWVILILTFTAYAYFFAGADWNSMSHFATIRSLAERGTADISPFTTLTGDVSIFQNGTFSSKPPGLALAGVFPYFCVVHVERWFGIDIDALRVWQINLHAMAAFLSALPAAILNVLVFYAFRREGARLRVSMLLAGGFAFGSLSWPYSGVLMAHMLCALFVFAAWYLLSRTNLTASGAAFAGALCGLGLLCDLLMVPLCAVFALYVLMRRAGIRTFISYLAGPIGGVLLMLLYNRIVHGHALDNAPLHPTGEFTRPGLLFGMLDWPQWIRLYWITLHPMRGLLWCCPLFLVPLCAILFIRRPFRMRLEYVVILFILASYIAFYLTYLTWTGGWGIGLRFMIPALALVWLFALPPARRFPKFTGGMIIWSIFNMLSITAVKPMFPAPNSGTPTDTDPVAVCRTHFLWGELNQSPDAHNLASLVGANGMWQMIPVFAILTAYFAYAFWMVNENPHAE